MLTSLLTSCHLTVGAGSPLILTSYFTVFPPLTTIFFKLVRSILGFTKILNKHVIKKKKVKIFKLT